MELQNITKRNKELSPPLLHQKGFSEVPVSSHSFTSRMFFMWVYCLLIKGADRAPEIEDLNPLAESEKVNSESLSKELAQSSLFMSIIKSHKSQMLLSILLGIIILLINYSNPLFMALLIRYLNSEDQSLYYSIALASSFAFISFLSPLLNSQKKFYVSKMVMKIRNSLYSIIYNRTLLSINLPEGTGVNLLQVDADKVCEFFGAICNFFHVPIQIAIDAFIIYLQVGNAVWAAIGTMVSVVIINILLSRVCKKLYKSIMKIRDQRIESSTQMLVGMKTIKAYTWEKYFMEKIQAIRKIELQKLRIMSLLDCLNKVYFWILPTLSFVVMISIEKIFVTLISLSMLQWPLIGVPYIVTKAIEVTVSIRRMNKVINAKPWSPVPHCDKISLKNCSFGYEEVTVLKNITLDIERGEFIGIIGPVGSGKSSFLLGLMGEISLKSGDLKVNNNIAYSPSLDSWLLNTTLRENVLIGREFKEKWYWEVLEACSLLPDINTLPAGDNTEIGERGINLSGGQKARICLARAVYSDKDIYLLDDPLSSVDNNVANHIFLNCFQKLLKNKTIILVTHRHNFLDRVDRVIELRDGEIYNISKCASPNFKFKGESPDKLVDNSSQQNKLIENEDRVVGKVDSEVYCEYFRLSGSYVWVLLAAVSMVFWLGTKMAGDIYLKNWTSSPSEVEYYLPVYVGLRLGSIVFIFFRGLFLGIIMSIKISYKVHQKLLASFIRAPINLFYDVTPIGRLLNRLTRDLNTIDESVANKVGEIMVGVCQCVGSILMGMIFFPYLIIFIPIIFFPGLYIKNLYIKTSRELARLESISRSPMISHYKETLSGARFIRVFKQTEYFIIKNQELINTNTRISYSVFGCNEWPRLYLSFLSYIVLATYFISAVMLKDQDSVGIIALGLSYMMQLPADFSEFLMKLNDIENQMVSVERVKAYTSLIQENPEATAADLKYCDWPVATGIRFHEVSMRYRPTTELVLKKLTFEIPPGLRVGITGRTGSGKSSVFLSLLRITEIHSGVIAIDGVNISLLGLNKLRKAITLIPQDPLLFSGTIEQNLDPFSLSSPKTISKALKDLDIKFGLDYEIKNNGQNISVGERQLLSLARALICNSKIILVDEATAGVDPETDEKIQKIIRKKFKNCTILTIAHRLGTIMDSDLVLVLSEGKVLEKGSPQDLMSYDSNFKLLSQKMY